jgi:hypothetical protein
MDGKLTRFFFTLAFAVGVTAHVHAIPQLRLQSISGGAEIADVTIIDGDVDGPETDLNSASGVILFSGALAGWNMNITSAFSKPFAGSELEPLLDLNSVSYSSEAGGTLNIWLTDTGFGPHSSAHVLAAIGGTTFGNVTFKAYYDESNTAFGTAHEITHQSFSPLAFAGETAGQLSADTPYSLTLLVSVLHQGAQMTSFDATVKVPEPSSLLLLGLGLLAFAVQSRNLRAKRA